MRPNVLLIVFDTARADAFEPYGAGEGAGPTVGQLARRGVAFPSTIAPSNWTMPSHASMFTGALPRSIGLAGAPGGQPANCRPVLMAQRDRLLPEVLRRSGYATAAISCNGWISPPTGFDTGFDRFEDIHTQRQGKLHSDGFRGRMAWAVEAMRARVDDGARMAEQVLTRWLQDGPSAPFFWFVNLVECHSPYMPPRPYNDLSVRERLRVAADARNHLTLTEFWRAALADYELPADTIGRMRHLYGRSIRSMDDWLARVLESLDRAKVLDDTIVIVTSDHGENFGEGQMIGHSFSLDQRLIWVPFVIAGPDRIAAERGMSLACLPRLIADAAGLDDHPWEVDPVPPGIGVSQYSGVIQRDDPRAQKAITDWRLDEEGILRLTCPATSATDGRWKVLRNGELVRVFDLQSDPFELAPLVGARPPEARAAIDRLSSTVDAAHPDPPPITPAPVPEGARGTSDAETADLEDRLRELGYL